MRSGPEAAIRPGNALPLMNIPVGQAIHNIELRPGAGGQLVRAAGTSAVLVSKSALTWLPAARLQRAAGPDSTISVRGRHVDVTVISARAIVASGRRPTLL